MDGASAQRTNAATEAALEPHNGAERVLANTPFMLTRCSSDLRYLFVSEAYARMIGRRPEDVVGKKIIEVIGETGFETILPHVKAVLSGQRVEYEQAVHFKEVGARLLHVICTPDTDRLGNVSGWVASIIDITDKRLAEQRIATDLKATTLLRQVGSECVRDDATLDECLHHILDAAISITGAQKGNIQLLDPSSGSLRIAAQCGFGQAFLDFFREVRDDAAACASALQTGSRIIVQDVLTSEIFVGQQSQKILLDEDIRAVISTPLVSSLRHTLGMLSTHFREIHEPEARELHYMDLLTRLAADYLERKRGQEIEKILLQEVQHRSNNLLAVVQAIAHHTLAPNSEATKAFEDRLLALAQCNKQITKAITGRLPLRDLIRSQVEAFSSRVTIHGPDVTVGSQLAQNVSLLCHELVTNAAKYGALKEASGTVEITWVISASRDAVELNWKEQHGPPVVTPQRTGFGTMLLKATFPTAQIDYAPDGLRCQVEIPIDKNDTNTVVFDISEHLPNFA